MPRVPQYDGPQVRDQPAPQVQLNAPDVGRKGRQIAAGLSDLSDVLQRQAERDDQDAAFRTEAQLKADWLQYEGQLRESRKGRDAATIDTETEQWWKDAAGKYGSDLSPNARRPVTRSLMASQLQAVAGAQAYKQQQLDASASASYQAAQGMSVNEAATIGTEGAATTALAVMAEKRAERARLQGWTPEQTKADETAWATMLHGTVLSKMMRADPAAAQTYFDKYRGQMDARAQSEIEGHLAQTSAALDGSNAAGSIWSSIGPKADGQPVELDKMEAQARERFAGDPTRQKATIDELRQRAAAFNASEGERKAGRVNAVMGAYGKGATMGQLRAMPEFQALGGQEQTQILEHINDRNHMLWARSVEDRARLEREQERKAYPAFLAYSDPETLGTMTRAQVQALLPAMGPQMTEHLITKWDGLQKAGARLEARMDSDDFNHVATRLGFDVFTKNKDDRKALGELKFRVEQLIDQAQAAKKGPLTREEKMNMMQDEMGRTVILSRGFFGFTDEVPVIQLRPRDLTDVQVPVDERAAIVEKMRQRYAVTKDPAFEPTEQNVINWYLLGKSKAAGFVRN
jgi:hypothetical protein